VRCCLIRWDKAAGMSLAPVLPNFASWWCFLFTKQFYTCALYHPQPAGMWSLGRRRFPCQAQLFCLVLVPLSLAHPLQTSSILFWSLLLKLLIPVLILCLHPPSPPRPFMPSWILFPLHFCLIFHAVADVNRDPGDATQASCPRRCEPPV